MPYPISRTPPGTETERREGVYITPFHNGMTIHIQRVNGDESVDTFIVAREEAQKLYHALGRILTDKEKQHDAN